MKLRAKRYIFTFGPLLSIGLLLSCAEPQNTSSSATSAATTSNGVVVRADFEGYWRPLIHEDATYRGGGPDKGDYAGLPVTEEARRVADTWDPEEQYRTEEQCKPHGAAYIMRGPARIRIFWEDESTLRLDTENWTQTRRFYLDGRDSPSGELEWQGHSVANWEGDTFKVITTHMRPRYLRRNGVPHSADAVMTEWFVRHGDYFTVISEVVDPLYLEEPLVRSSTYRKLPDDTRFEEWICEPVEWPGGAPGADPLSPYPEMVD